MWPNRSLVNRIVPSLEAKRKAQTPELELDCEEACRTQSSEHCLWFCIDQRYNAGPSDPVSLYSEDIDQRLSDTTQNQDEASVRARSRRVRGVEDETGSIASSEFRFVHLIRGCLQADMAALCRRIFPGGLPQRYHMPKETTLKTTLKRFRLGPLSYLALHSADRRVDLLLTAERLSV